MKQIIIHGQQSEPSGSTWTGFGGQLLVTLEGQAQTPWHIPGTFRKFTIDLEAAPGGVNGWALTVYKNGVATAMSVTITGAATSGEDLTNEVTVAQGDLLTLRWAATGTPAQTGVVFYGVEFEGTNAAESGYAQQPGIIVDSGRRTGVFWPCYQSSDTWTNIAGNQMENVVPTSGTLTGMSIWLSQIAGTGKSLTFNIYKNGVKQDGTGGTVNTTVTISDSGTTGTASFSLALAAGDRVYTEVVTSGSPNADIRAGIGFGFVADTDGESIMGGWVSVDHSDTSTQYSRLHGFFDSYLGEAASQAPGHPTSFPLSKFYARAYTAPGGTDSWTLTIRDSGADTALSVTIVGSSQQESDLVSSATVTSASLLALQVIPTDTPTVGKLTWSVVQTIALPIIGSFVAGADGKVTSTRTALFNLDGVDRTGANAVSAEGSLAVGGNLMLIEQGSVPDGIANAARIFTEDNGSGKTRLMVQFGTGSAVQIAIES